jgi:hypothetical protein
LRALHIAAFLVVFHNDEFCVSLFQDKTYAIYQKNLSFERFFL